MTMSGYEAVHVALLCTEETEAILSSLRMWSKQAKLIDYTFKVDVDGETGLAKTWTCWQIRWGNILHDFRDDVYTNFRFDTERGLEGADNVIVRACLKRDPKCPRKVGTRNCDRNIILSGRGATYNKRWGRHRQDEVRSFAEALLQHANGDPDLADLRKRAESRIIGEMIKIHRSDEWVKRRLQALRDAAVAEVSKVMFKYRELPASFIDDAVQNGIVACVMDA